MYLRFKHQLKYCKGIENLPSNVSEKVIRRHIQINEATKIIYCGIEKAGSTFWRRFFQYLNKRIVQSPYNIKPEKVAENHVDIRKTNLVKLLGLLQLSTKFIFVRNPYTRLLSGYVDKIYSPNPYYWKLGAKAVRHARKIETPCGHETTFKEFVDYIIHAHDRKLERDEHFIPGHEMCIPCQIQYNYIGKIETFIGDTFYILEKLNLTQYLPYLKDFKKQSISDAIYDVSQAFVKFRKGASKCLRSDDSLKRIWRKLQIRGIIANELKFPFNLNDSRFMQERELSKALEIAHKQSQTYDLKTQKQSHLIKAYRTIPLETMFKLADVYKLDFKIFDYEQFPIDLFQNRSSSLSDIFSINTL